MDINCCVGHAINEEQHRPQVSSTSFFFWVKSLIYLTDETTVINDQKGMGKHQKLHTLAVGSSNSRGKQDSPSDVCGVLGIQLLIQVPGNVYSRLSSNYGIFLIYS